MIDWLALGAVWALAIRAIGRGYLQERQVDRYALLTWGIFVSLGGLMTVRVPAIERAIDGRFGDQPVAYWLDAMTTLSAAGLYAASLLMFPQENMPLRARHRRLAWSVAVCAVAVSAILLGGFAELLSREKSFHLMRWALALDMLAVIGGMFIPLNGWLFQNETVTPMRVKHLAMLTGLVAYVSGAVVALTLVPPHLVDESVPSDPGARLRLVVGALCMAVILSPHRWIVAALLPLKWHRYRQITALERQVARRVAAPREPFDWRQVFWAQYVEFATYLAVINILDHYRFIEADDEAGWRLRQRIDTVWRQHPAYDDLVKALSRVSA